MVELMHAFTRLLRELWPVLAGGIIVLLSLLMLVRVGQASLALGMGSGREAAGFLLAALSTFFLVLFVLTAVDDLARAAMRPFSCAPGGAGDLFEPILQAALYLLYAVTGFRFLLAAFRGLQAAALGAGSPLALAAWETAAVLVASLALPFLTAFVSLYMDVC